MVGMFARRHYPGFVERMFPGRDSVSNRIFRIVNVNRMHHRLCNDGCTNPPPPEASIQVRHGLQVFLRMSDIATATHGALLMHRARSLGLSTAFYKPSFGDPLSDDQHGTSELVQTVRRWLRAQEREPVLTQLLGFVKSMSTDDACNYRLVEGMLMELLLPGVWSSESRWWWDLFDASLGSLLLSVQWYVLRHVVRLVHIHTHGGLPRVQAVYNTAMQIQGALGRQSEEQQRIDRYAMRALERAISVLHPTATKAASRCLGDSRLAESRWEYRGE